MCGDKPCGPCKQKNALRARMKEYNRGREMIQKMTMAGELTGSKPVKTGPYMGDPTGEVAEFIEPIDKLGAWLAVKIYTERPSQVMGFVYEEEMSSSRIGVWLGCSTAYVVFRGTQPLAPGGVSDIIDDFILASDDTCDLSISQVGVQVINELAFSRGYMDIRLSGHSLGGRAALCAGNQWGVTRVVALNAGAPVISPSNAGPGPQKATHYHIVGDVVSTHLEDTAARNVRILIGNPPKRIPYAEKFSQFHIGKVTPEMEKNFPPIYDLNWIDSNYHSSTRFLVGDSWKTISPQEEQDSLELFVFGTGDIMLKLSSAATSLLGFPFDTLLKTSVCQNLIPGANQGLYCKTENSQLIQSFHSMMNFLAGVTGALAGLVLIGPGGVVAGFKAGSDLSKGDLQSLANELIPGWELMTEGNKLFIQRVIEDIRRRRGDTLDDIIQDRFGKFNQGLLDYTDPMLAAPINNV